jgi:hypothetical protein
MVGGSAHLGIVPLQRMGVTPPPPPRDSLPLTRDARKLCPDASSKRRERKKTRDACKVHFVLTQSNVASRGAIIRMTKRYIISNIPSPPKEMYLYTPLCGQGTRDKRAIPSFAFRSFPHRGTHKTNQPSTPPRFFPFPMMHRRFFAHAIVSDCPSLFFVPPFLPPPAGMTSQTSSIAFALLPPSSPLCARMA